MADWIDKVKKAVKGEDKPRKPYQSGPRVANKSRLEGACAAGSEDACKALDRLKEAQSTDSNN